MPVFKNKFLNIAMLGIHSCPIGKLGTNDTGGMSVYIRELAVNLGRAGHRVDIFTRLREDDHPPLMRLHENVRLIHLDIPASRRLTRDDLYPHLPDFLTALEKFRRAEGADYDLIHSHYWLAGLLGSWVQKLWVRHHITTFHTLGSVKNAANVKIQDSELRISMEKGIVKSCDRILAPTRREKENLARHYQAAVDRIGIVPCGVDLDRFFPADKSAARTRLGLGREDRILLYVGRFDPLKGLNRLFEAMAHLENVRRLRLIVVGGDENNDPRLQHLRQMVSELVIDRRVVFTGRIDQEKLPAYYGAADAVVIPSYYESFGLVGLEALACGRPVISTPVGVMADLAEQNNPGVLTTEFSSRSFARGIEATLKNLRRVTAEEIRAVVSEYNWPLVSEAVLGEYRKALAETTKAASSCCSLEARTGDRLWSSRQRTDKPKAARCRAADHPCCV